MCIGQQPAQPQWMETFLTPCKESKENVVQNQPIQTLFMLHVTQMQMWFSGAMKS